MKEVVNALDLNAIMLMIIPDFHALKVVENHLSLLTRGTDATCVRHAFQDGFS